MSDAHDAASTLSAIKRAAVEALAGRWKVEHLDSMFSYMCIEYETFVRHEEWTVEYICEAMDLDARTVVEIIESSVALSAVLLDAAVADLDRYDEDQAAQRRTAKRAARKAALAVVCPTCSAGVGERCVTSGGHPVKDWHASRRGAA